MIVSHEHKFIFLKTKKTAGTSVELALSQLCGPRDIITPLTEIDEALRATANGRGSQNWRLHGWWRSSRPFWERRFLKFTAQDYGFYNHMPAKEAKAVLADDKTWQSYFKFAFERNPWDRQVSAYHFRYRRETQPPCFSDFVDRDWRARLNNYEIYSLDGEPCVDFIGRFEALESDFRYALGQIGLSFDHALPHAKPSVRQNNQHYRDYYDDRTRDLIGSWYEREIKLLSYSF